ncbi:MAG: hypothetical protein V4794_19465 [Pseudomonadota bacterium]
MTVVKGKLSGVEVSEDGSNVKVRLSSGDAVVLNEVDLRELTEQLINAGLTMKLNALEGGLPNRFVALPEVVRVETFNALTFRASGELSLDLRFSNTRRLVVHLTEPQRDYLLHVASQQGGSQSLPH